MSVIKVGENGIETSAPGELYEQTFGGQISTHIPGIGSIEMANRKETELIRFLEGIGAGPVVDRTVPKFRVYERTIFEKGTNRFESKEEAQEALKNRKREIEERFKTLVLKKNPRTLEKLYKEGGFSDREVEEYHRKQLRDWPPVGSEVKRLHEKKCEGLTGLKNRILNTEEYETLEWMYDQVKPVEKAPNFYCCSSSEYGEENEKDHHPSSGEMEGYVEINFNDELKEMILNRNDAENLKEISPRS